MREIILLYSAGVKLLVRDAPEVGMFESLDRCDPLGLVQTEKLLEEVHSLAGYNAGWRGVSGQSSGSQTLADLGEVRLGQVQAEGDSPLVPETSVLTPSHSSPHNPTFWPPPEPRCYQKEK